MSDVPPLEDLLARHRAAGGAGRRGPAEAVLERFPALRDDPVALVELLGQEMLLRGRDGEAPDVEACLRRFPWLGSQARRVLADALALADSFCSSSTSQRSSHPPTAPPQPQAPAVVPVRMAEVLGEIDRLGLLAPQQREQCPRLAGQASGLGLCRELLGRNWLTGWQANRLLTGRGCELVLGGYVLLKRLGGGGMGEVFQARRRSDGLLVAL